MSNQDLSMLCLSPWKTINAKDIFGLIEPLPPWIKIKAVTKRRCVNGLSGTRIGSLKTYMPRPTKRCLTSGIGSNSTQIIQNIGYLRVRVQNNLPDKYSVWTSFFFLSHLTKTFTCFLFHFLVLSVHEVSFKLKKARSYISVLLDILPTNKLRNPKQKVYLSLPSKEVSAKSLYKVTAACQEISNWAYPTKQRKL